MRGVSEGLPAISFLRFSQKRHLIFFSSAQGEQLLSQLLPVFAAADPQDGPVRSRVYRAKTHSRAGRFALFSARQASSPLVSPAFWRSAVQRRHKLNATSERDKESHKRHRAAASAGEHKSPVLFKRSLKGFRGLRAPPLLVPSVMQMQRL